MKFHQVEHEQAILGAIKLDNQAYDEIQLSPEEFYDPRNQAIYQAVGHIIETGGVADDLTIVDELRKTGDVSSEDAGYVAELQGVTKANISYYAEQVHECYLKRKLFLLIPTLKDGLKNKESAEIIADIEGIFTDLCDGHANNMRLIKDILYSAVKTVEERYNSGGGLTGVPTGFTKLNEVTNGFQPGNLIVIGARPSIGKTAMALTMATKAAKAGFQVGFFSCEMAEEQIAWRLLAGEAKISISNISSGRLGPAAWNDLTAGCGRLYDLPLLLDDTPNAPLQHIKSRARQMKRRGVQIIFVDYLTLIKHGTMSISRPERVGEISKQLKGLARELNLPVVVLSQLNRDAEGKQPNLGELRQSGEIEEDSDCVILLHRKRDDKPELTWVNVAKNRNGGTRVFTCVFLPEYVRFEDREWEKEG